MGPIYILWLWQVDFYEVTNHKITNNSASTEATETIGADLGSSEFYKVFDLCLTYFKNNQIYLIKNKPLFLLTTNLGETSSLDCHCIGLHGLIL